MIPLWQGLQLITYLTNLAKHRNPTYSAPTAELTAFVRYRVVVLYGISSTIIFTSIFLYPTEVELQSSSAII